MKNAKLSKLEQHLRAILRDAFTNAEIDRRAFEVAVHRIDAALAAHTRHGGEHPSRETENSDEIIRQAREDEMKVADRMLSKGT